LTSEAASAAASSYKPPNTWGNYSSLRNCAKWCLTGCRDASDDCRKPPKPAICFPSVTGMDSLGCRTTFCLCAGENFARSVEFIGECLVKACAMDFMELPDADYTGVVSVLATYCGTENFGAYTFPPKPQTPNNCSTPTSPPNSSAMPQHGGYTTDQKIALGVGLGIGIPTLIASVIGAYGKTSNLRKKMRDLAAQTRPVPNTVEGQDHSPLSSSTQSRGRLQSKSCFLSRIFPLAPRIKWN